MHGFPESSHGDLGSVMMEALFLKLHLPTVSKFLKSKFSMLQIINIESVYYSCGNTRSQCVCQVRLLTAPCGCTFRIKTHFREAMRSPMSMPLVVICHGAVRSGHERDDWRYSPISAGMGKRPSRQPGLVSTRAN